MIINLFRSKDKRLDRIKDEELDDTPTTSTELPHEIFPGILDWEVDDFILPTDSFDISSVYSLIRIDADGTVWVYNKHRNIKSIPIRSFKVFSYYNASCNDRIRELERQKIKRKFENGDTSYQKYLNSLKKKGIKGNE